MSNANRSIAKNYLYNTSYLLFQLIVPLVTVPYVSRVLGPDGIGKFSFASSIAAYFMMLAGLGSGWYMQRTVAALRDDKQALSNFFGEMLIVRTCTVAFSCGLYLIVTRLLGFTDILYTIIAIEIIGMALDVTWLFHGNEEFGITVSRNIIIRIIGIALIFLFVRTKADVPTYALLQIGSGVVANASLWAFLRRRVIWPKISISHFPVHVKSMIALFVPQIAIQVYTVLDKTMIGVITQSALENGYYEQSLKIVRMFLAVITAMGSVMLPRIANLHSKGDHGEMQRKFETIFRFVWILACPMMFGIAAIAPTLVPWFLGREFAKSTILVQLLSPLILAIGINNALGIQFLIGTGREKIFTYSVLLGAAVNFSLNSLLIFRFQAVGAVIASVCAESVIAIVQYIYITRKFEFEISVKKTLRYLYLGAFMGIVVYTIGQLMMPTTINTCILVVIGVFVYLGSLMILKDKFLCTMIDHLKKLRS